MESETKEQYLSAVWLCVELDTGWDGVCPPGCDRGHFDLVIQACFEGGISEKTVSKVIAADLLAHGALLGELSENDADFLRGLVPVSH